MCGLRDHQQELREPLPCTHTGLWLDRFLRQSQNKQSEQNDAHSSSASAKQDHLSLASKKIRQPFGYKSWFDKRSEFFHQLSDTTVVEAEVLGRMIVGLGADSVWENNISLHHTWGVPMIPGSALKGLSASYAHRFLSDENWRRRTKQELGRESHNTLFGTTDEQGLVIFHDAVWKPTAKGVSGLELDVLTVHHQKYYQDGNTSAPPADWDSPIPVSFLSCQGSFLFALTGPKPWRDAAFNILEKALMEVGIGAKTSSGYGRMELKICLSDKQKNFISLEKSIQQFNYDGASKPGSKNQLSNKLEELVLLKNDLAPSLLLAFFEGAFNQSKFVRKGLCKSLSNIIEQWSHEQQKSELLELYKKVFEDPQLSTARAKVQTRQEEVDWEGLAKTFIENISDEYSTLAEALSAVETKYLREIFREKPSNKKMRPFQQAVSVLIRDMFPEQNESQLQNDIKKYIKNIF